MKNKIKQKIATVSSLILGLTFGLSNQPAQATSANCQSFGLNATCVRVVGSGLSVNSIKGYFEIDSTQNPLCKWHYRLSFQDTNNKEYAYINQPNQGVNNCTIRYYSGSFTKNYSPSYKAKAGRICASLYSNDNYVTQACVTIKP